jgi:aspartate carbamoyltransferase regulatory subunit
MVHQANTASLYLVSMLANILSTIMLVYVSTLTGKTISLDVEPYSTIEDLKVKIQYKEGVPANKQRLQFEGKVLKNDCILSDWNIQNGSKLGLSQWGDPNFSVNRFENPVVQEFSVRSPDYRRVRQGLNFTSKCINQRCVAYQNTIIVQKGFGHFNVVMEGLSLECPKCGQPAEASTNCGFYLAQWTCTGIPKGGRRCRAEGRTTTREYFTWEEGNNIQWSALEVQVDPYTP